MKTKPLKVLRRSLRKNGKPSLPWVFRCGCGLKSECKTFDIGLNNIRYHSCDDRWGW